jgi:DNA-binding transcriptional LysR family regulator
MVLASLSLVVEAMREGLGIGLLPLPHIARDLESGRLVAPFGMHTRQGGFLLSCSRQWAKRREVHQLVEWLRVEGIETNAVRTNPAPENRAV